VPSLVRGRIVYPKTPIPDPQGQNPKEGGPFVVISRDEDIKKGGSIHAVGITGEVQSSPAEHYESRQADSLPMPCIRSSYD
jgi:hypothetical protein